MYSRLLKIPTDDSSSFFIFGPRGTGKTTWLRRHFRPEQSVYLDLLDSGIYTELLAAPQRLESFVSSSKIEWLILDEVQRIPSLLSEVHRLIEARGLKFAMTGSSARSLRKRGVNLLAGRALTYHLHPLAAAEMGDDFDVRHAIQYGMLPAISSHSMPGEYLKSYVTTYLREEIQQEGFTRNLANFTRFLETASFSQASPLNVAGVARESSLNRNVVDAYFGILEDLLIAVRLPVFTKRAKRRLVAHPKFYYFDAGVYRTIRPRGPLDTPEEADGACIETLCLQQLRAVNDTMRLEYNVHFWRTSDGTEVDFVLYGPHGLKAFEIKRSHRYSRGDLTGLKAFRQDYPIAECYLLYGGEHPREEDGIRILPLADALKNLPEILT